MSSRTAVRKNFKLLKHERIIYHFKARDLEIPLILIVRENRSKNRFSEISSSVHEIAKLKYFAKVIAYSKFPKHVLQSYT